MKGTMYSLRLIPLGGYVSMEGEESPSEEEGSFSKASFWKKMGVVLAGPIVNIVFGLVVYFILISIIYNVEIAGNATMRFIVISLSLGLTNLLPIPPLDGGKLLIYVIEGIKRKPLKEETSLRIQMLGFMFIIGLSIFVMYNDITRIV